MGVNERGNNGDRQWNERHCTQEAQLPALRHPVAHHHSGKCSARAKQYDVQGQQLEDMDAGHTARRRAVIMLVVVLMVVLLVHRRRGYRVCGYPLQLP